MAKITEDYVSFEVAKLLKEKGFDEWVDLVYLYFTKDDIRTTELSYHKKCQSLKPHSYPLITHQMAMKWLREVHKIDICAFPEHYDYILWGYNCQIYKNKEQLCSSKNFKFYEQACEAAIKYCLENLI